MVFLEDYDLQLARWLVTGVDVWLNNPVAPLEASGTSGIKAAVNGRLNVSILDGWWAEGFDQNNGWGIPGADVQDPERRDALDAAAMLDAIEEEVVPLYYARNDDGYSPEWVRRCKRAMMTGDPALQHGPRGAGLRARAVLPGGPAAPAPDARRRRRPSTALAAWKQRVRERWAGCGTAPPVAIRRANCRAPAQLNVRVAAALNGLTAQRRAGGIRGAARAAALAHGAAAAVLVPRREPRRRLARAAAPHRRDRQRRLDRLRAATPRRRTAASSPSRSGSIPWHELLAHPLELGLLKRL